MTDTSRSYESDTIRVRFTPGRCIHAARCVSGLRTVFDRDRRPWIDPNRAEAQAIADVVAQCPSGALQYERLDGGTAEMPDAANSVRIVANGPAHLRGTLVVQRADGSDRRNETRLALCRCGASANKPFCDGSHAKVGFTDPGVVTREMSSDPPAAGTLAITPRANGSVLLEGPFAVIDGSGRTVGSLPKCGLCRCGHSKNKPFCDASHKAAGFQAD